MTLSEVLTALQITDAQPLFTPHWEESAACLPQELPPFLDPQQCTALRAFTNLQPEVDEALVDIARQVVASPALLHLAWHCYRLVFHHPDYSSSDIAKWPWLEHVLGKNHGLFYVLVVLGAIPLVQEFHARRGVPEAISRDTVSHYRELMRLRWDETGERWTVLLAALYWTRYHAWGDLYSLGRMEYMVRPFGQLVRAYRHRATGRVLALVAGTYVCTADGYMNAGETVESRPGNWETVFEEHDDHVVGCPVSPRGHALPQTVTLKLSEWELVLKQGDMMLDVHIPAGGNFTPDKCQDSMARAMAFFTRYFPDRPYRGFCCGSWILDPGIAQWYRPDSNMVRWQEELYLFPWPSGQRTGLFFLFDDGNIDLATAPRDTSMRRAALDHLQAGGWMRAGGMFMLKEDFPRYGEQVYRSNWGGELLGLEG